MADWADWALALSPPPPLVAPLVTPTLWAREPDSYLARGVLVCEEGRWKVHAEVMDDKNAAYPMEEWQSSAISWALEKEFETATAPWRPGDACGSAKRGFPAVHCQADSLTSVAAQIRDGQLILRLMQTLYLESPRHWTLRGINIGAGIDNFPLCEGNNTYCNQDDPLDLWLSHEAKQIVLIDGDSYRLKQAIKKAMAKRSNDEELEVLTLNQALTPLDVEDMTVKKPTKAVMCDYVFGKWETLVQKHCEQRGFVDAVPVPALPQDPEDDITLVKFRPFDIRGVSKPFVDEFAKEIEKTCDVATIVQKVSEELTATDPDDKDYKFVLFFNDQPVIEPTSTFYFSDNFSFDNVFEVRIYNETNED
eukprot:s521_g11.t3